MFIRHALVYGEWTTHQPFYRENLRLLEEAEELEHRARRRDIVVDEQTLFDFYDARVGAGRRQRRALRPVVEARRGDASPSCSPSTPRCSPTRRPRRCARPTTRTPWEARGADLPDQLPLRARRRRRRPHHRRPRRHPQPGRGRRLLLARARAARGAGDQLIRSLPKSLRVAFVPAPNTARDFLDAGAAGGRAAARRPRAVLAATTGVVVPREAWDWAKVPDHLRPTYRVVRRSRRRAGRSKDLDALKEPLQPAFADAMAEVASDSGLSATGQTAWTFGTVEESFVQRRAGHEVRGFPALVDEGSDGRAAGARLGRRGRGAPPARRPPRCCCWALRPRRRPAGRARQRAKLGLAGSPYPTVAELLDDVRAAVVGAVVDEHPPVRDETAYAALAERARRIASSDRPARCTT